MSAILNAAAHPMVFPWLCLVFGLMVGSFLNVVIHRLPRMMERGWQEECAELLRTGEPYPRVAGDASPAPYAPVPPPQPNPETYNLFVPRSDRKSTRLNSSHGSISYAVFCLKKKKNLNLLLRSHPPIPQK